MCAVEEHWYRRLSAAEPPGALSLEEDVLAAIGLRRQAVQARAAAECAAATGTPGGERPESAEQCLHGRREIPAGTFAVIDGRGWLHPSCVPSCLDVDVVDGARCHRALGELSEPEDLEALAEVLERY